MGGGRSTYIPPHMRGVPPAADGPPPPMMNGSAQDGAWNGARSAESPPLPKSVLARSLIHRSAMTSAAAPALNTNGPVHQISPPERTVLLQHHSIPEAGMRRSATIELSTPTHTVSLAVPIPVEDRLVDLATANGVMGNTSQDLPTLASSVSFSVFPTIHQSCRQASTFRTMTIFLWKHLVKMYQTPSFNSLTHHSMTTFCPTSD